MRLLGLLLALGAIVWLMLRAGSGGDGGSPADERSTTVLVAGAMNL